MFVEYAENEWVGLERVAEIRITMDDDGFTHLRIVRIGGDRDTPERYIFESSDWAEYARKVLRAAAIAVAGEP